ncbi:fibronectin type III domain-containing protein isoform X4 [Nematostella vectensis]|uniref:fibronectin type III domain-containing protein isoform X4 n=1 Tax=Nematostella vectensis TaxID=45351 RepID=UPI00207738BD|nr:fibronectin type III domain-containing protein isoform X4 [Nematostella vectensis]XP_048584297.1 fibronectin type III domain-containing protein isoform X4 [Nematostella vectensis]XP_048584298.1 fibronectin type III domain-containing protein isoform X4 [Nematostella vectensis]
MFAMRWALSTLVVLCLVSGSHVGANAYSLEEAPPLITSFPAVDLINAGDVILGKPLTIPCKASGSPPLWHAWFVDGSALRVARGSEYQQTQEGALVVTFKTLKEKEVQFQCVVSNSFGTVFSRILKVAVTGIKERFAEADTASGKDKKVYGSYGLAMVLRCPSHQVALGANYTWIKHNHVSNTWEPLAESKYYEVTSKGDLVFAAMMEEYFRVQLRCRVSVGDEYFDSHTMFTSDHGSKTTKEQSVLRDAELVEKPATLEVALRGARKELRCIPTGNPVPEIVWFDNHNNEIADGTNGYRFQSHGRVLVIDRADESSAGAYTCACRAHTSSKAVAHTKVVIKGPPVLTAIPKPEVKLMRGDDLALVCQAKQTFEDTSHQSLITFEWYRNNQQLADSDKIAIDDGNLRVKNVSDRDNGVYQCVARDNMGMSTAASRVMIKGVTCSAILAPRDSQFFPRSCHQKSSFSPGDTCRAICKLGFEGKGARDERKCLPDGGWTSINYECQDNMPPTILPGKGCPNDITITTARNNSKAAYVTWKPPQAVDNTGNLVTRIEPSEIKGSGHWLRLAPKPHVIKYHFIDSSDKRTTCSFKVHVISRTVITSRPPPLLYVLIGKDLALDCKAHAHGAVVYSWTRIMFTQPDKTIQVQNTSRIHLMSGGQQLSIKSFSARDSGKYTCKVMMKTYDIPGSVDTASSSVDVVTKVEWSKWKPWTACSKCGVPGVRMRNRTCQKPGSPRQAIGCVGKERETEACFESCPTERPNVLNAVGKHVNTIKKIATIYHDKGLQWLRKNHPEFYKFLLSKRGRVVIICGIGAILISIILMSLACRKLYRMRHIASDTESCEKKRTKKKNRRSKEKRKVIKTLTSSKEEGTTLEGDLQVAKPVVLEEDKKRDEMASERRRSIYEATSNPRCQGSLRESIQQSYSVILPDESDVSPDHYHEYHHTGEVYVDENGNEYVNVAHTEAAEDFVYDNMEGYDGVAEGVQYLGEVGQEEYVYELVDANDDGFIYENVGYD